LTSITARRATARVWRGHEGVDRQLRFAVVTAFAHEDWHSQQVFLALSRLAQTAIVDPAELSALLAPPTLQAWRSGEAAVFDAYVLVRGMSPRGDADAQLSLYRALALSGCLVVNRVDALLDAQDKLRTSHLLGEHLRLRLHVGHGLPAGQLLLGREVPAQERRREAVRGREPVREWVLRGRHLLQRGLWRPMRGL